MEGQLTEQQKQEIKNTAIIWGVVAVVITSFVVLKNNAPTVIMAGFFAKTFAILLGSVLGLIGAMIGDAIRRFALPDGYFTTGGMGSILKTKIFWAIGPQTIGVVFGSLLGPVFVLY